MRLTRYTDYALRTLLYLGLHGRDLASIGDIARAYGISENHLTKVVHHLGRLGFVETVRGRGGGLRLARAPEAIGIGEVVRRTEDDLALVDCFTATSCAIAGACGLQRALGEALAAFLGVLDRYTLADLLRPGGAATAARLGLPAFDEAAGHAWSPAAQDQATRMTPPPSTRSPS
jgi:Rrf2 family transcriptional regulator, nitric oxide-sensitive transcriptional repressor